MNNILTEKYRPNSLDEIVGQDEIVNRIKECVKNKRLHHMMFVGKPGIGKTSLANALAKDYFGKSWEHSFTELNASDDRTLKIVREKIKTVAETEVYDGEFRIIFLDEADYLEYRAQPALRRIIEDYSDTCRFILSCNYGNKIIEPIVDRLIEYRFKSLKLNDFKLLLKKIADKEELIIKPDAYVLFAKTSKGSMRKAISILGAFKDEGVTEITADAIKNRFIWIDEIYIKKIIYYAVQGDMEKADKMIDDMISQNLLVSAEVLDYMRLVIRNAKSITDDTKLLLIDKIGEINFRISCGCDANLQLKAFTAFMIYHFRNGGKKD